MRHFINFLKGIIKVPFLIIKPILFIIGIVLSIPLMLVAVLIAIGEGEISNASQNPVGKIINKLHYGCL